MEKPDRSKVLFSLVLFISSSKDVTRSPTKSKPLPKSSPAKPVEPVKPVKAVSAADFFGSSPVERTERKVCATKRKQVSWAKCYLPD